MAIYYVASGGDGTAPTVDPTGDNWASVYASLKAVEDGLLIAANDFIYVANDHLYQTAVATVISLPDNVTILSVDRVTLAYAIGAKEEQTASSVDYSLRGRNLVSKGVDYINGRTFITAITGDALHIEDSILSNLNVNQELFVIDNGGVHFLKNCSITSGDDLISAPSNVGAKATFMECDISIPSADRISEALGDGAHLVVKFINCDLTGILTTGYLFSLSDNALLTVEFINCKLPNAFIDYVDTSVIATYDINVASCTNGVDHSSYHYFYSSTKSGVTEEDTAVYLDATYDGTNGFSAALSSSASASLGMPLSHKLLTQNIDLTTSKTFTVNFQSDTVLSDSDFWIEISRNDATDQALGVIQSSRSLLQATAGDIIDTTVKYTDDNNAGWSGTSQTYQYSTAITVVGMVGVDNANLTVTVFLSAANTDVNVCPLVVVS